MLAAVNWTVFGVLLTALFTGLGLIVAFLAYQHGRQIAGFRKPIVIRRPLDVGKYHEEVATQDKPYLLDGLTKYDRESLRLLRLHIFNYSNAKQTLLIEDAWIAWPLSARGSEVLTRDDEMTFSPHSGGNTLHLVVGRKPWDESVVAGLAITTRQRYLVRVRARTRSGKRIRFTGWIRLMKIQEWVEPK